MNQTGTSKAAWYTAAC